MWAWTTQLFGDLIRSWTSHPDSWPIASFLPLFCSFICHEEWKSDLTGSDIFNGASQVARDTADVGSISESGISSGVGYGNPLWYSCLENTMDRGAWCAPGHGVAKSRTWLKWLSWRRKWQLTPVFLPGEYHGQRSLVGYRPWGHEESDITEWLNTISIIKNGEKIFLNSTNLLFLRNVKNMSAAAKSLQSCPTLCDPIDSSPPGSPIPGILQARILEWVAISFSNAWKWKVKVTQLYPTLSNPMDCSLPGSSIHRIFQARVLE